MTMDQYIFTSQVACACTQVLINCKTPPLVPRQPRCAVGDEAGGGTSERASHDQELG